MNRCLLQLAMSLAIFSIVPGCAKAPTTVRHDLSAWVGVSVETLDTHTFFMTVPMFRTKTANGTEIRNYAYAYDFQECFSKAGATNIGDFVNEDDFITCSSSRIMCNNLFYIKEEIVLEYAPTGRCDTDEKIRPNARNIGFKN